MILTTPIEGQPLTRRRARELAKPGVSLSAASSTVDPVIAEPAADVPAETSTAGPIADAAPPTHTAEPLLADFELLEPQLPDATDVDDTVEADEAEAPADEFEAAARLFSFTGETPVQAAAAEPEVAAEFPAEPVSHFAKRRANARMTGASFKRMAATSFSVGVMGVVGLLTVGLTTPAEAVAAAGTTAVTSVAPAGDVYAPDSSEIQAYVAPAQVEGVDLGRTETYSAGTLVDLAGTVGISNYSSAVFTNNPSCSIQWPFATGVTMSYGFGMRSGRMHEGVDFTPGAGAHIQAIADGVVRISTDSGGAYGVTIVIDHVVDGQLVSSRYAHMQYGSRQVQVGDTVSVGQFIGQTGNTGRSYGAHTHVEILQNGTTPIDPLPWLRTHATC